MADIVSLHGDEHQQVQCLLPWYATGRLDPGEAGLVEQHLRDCGVCRADLATERELARCVARHGFDAAMGWRSLRRRIAPRPARPRRTGIAATVRHWLDWPMKLGWFLAAPAVVGLLFVIVALPAPHRAEYHTLGDRASPTGGNVIVLFRPETSEADMRRLLNADHARIVDGPNAAGAYVLAVPQPQREAILNQLRATPAILLAQPIDLAAGP